VCHLWLLSFTSRHCSQCWAVCMCITWWAWINMKEGIHAQLLLPIIKPYNDGLWDVCTGSVENTFTTPATEDFLAGQSLCSFRSGYVEQVSVMNSICTAHSQHTYSTHTQHTYSIRTAYLQNTHCILTAYLQNTHCILTAYLQHTHCILTAYLQHTHSILTAHSLHTYSTLTAYLQHTHSILTAHSQHTYSILGATLHKWLEI
jgi:hypothetical protein